MKLHRKITTSKFNTVVIESEDPDLIEHFRQPNNYADVIIDQINTERLYDFMFKDQTDLVVLDIGANIGLFTLYVQDSARAVYCLEPTPSHFNLLSKITAPYQNVTLLPVALHSENSLIDFYLFDQNSTMNSTVNKYGRKVQVQGQNLLTVLNTNGLDHVDFVKCDIEGSEMAAITNDTVASVADRVDSWFLEIHATEHGNIYSNREHIKKIFENNGYDTMDFKHDGICAFKV